MEGTIGEIRLFASNFAPKNWAYCAGQILSIAQNTALFSILGTTYGGDGRVTFALPDLRGRVPISAGQGAGLPNYVLGEVLGSETVTLTVGNLPSHNHLVAANGNAANGVLNDPTGAYWSAGPVNRSTGNPVNTRFANTPNSTMLPASITPSGGNQPVSIIQPTLAINYIICMFGLFPSRN